MWELLLRLHMLTAFIHEVAHHYDFTFRVDRGRWRFDDIEKIEIYAESVQHEWITAYVIPYIVQAHPGEFEQLRAWMKTHVGVEVPLELLIGEVRTRTSGGVVNAEAAFFNTGRAFEAMLRHLADGMEPAEARLQFARDLHYACVYDLPQRIIDFVLEAAPHNAEALSLRGDILAHRERYDAAIEAAMEALA